MGRVRSTRAASEKDCAQRQLVQWKAHPGRDRSRQIEEPRNLCAPLWALKPHLPLNLDCQEHAMSTQDLTTANFADVIGAEGIVLVDF